MCTSYYHFWNFQVKSEQQQQEEMLLVGASQNEIQDTQKDYYYETDGEDEGLGGIGKKNIVK